jgi:hypothetical protein
VPPEYDDDLEDDDDFEDEGEPECSGCGAPVAMEGQLCPQCNFWENGSNRWPR